VNQRDSQDRSSLRCDWSEASFLLASESYRGTILFATQGYFKRTIKNVVVYRDAISEVIRQAKAKADCFEGVVLVGESELAFIVEHECYKQGVEYRLEAEADEKSGGFSFLAETLDNVVLDGKRSGCFALSWLIVSG